MSTIYQVNIAAAFVMAACCFVILAMSHSREDLTHVRAFLLFWGINAAIGAVDRIWAAEWEFYKKHISVQYAFDAISNMAVLLAALSLYKRDRFRWDDRALLTLAYMTPVLFFIEFGLGWLSDRETQIVWKLFYTTPGAFIATVGLTLVAMAAFREPRISTAKWPIGLLFALYAYLQIPGYVCDFIQTDNPVVQAQLDHGKQVILSFLAATKFGLSMALGILVWVELAKSSPEVAASRANIGLSIMSSALAAFIFFYRIAEVTGLAQIPTR